MLTTLLRAAWDGLCLRCPACRGGSMARGSFDLVETCPACGAAYAPEEGDFLGAMVLAYSATALLLMVGICLAATLTTLSARGQLLLWGSLGSLFLVATYRNMKGAWVGILYAITGLRRGGR